MIKLSRASVLCRGLKMRGLIRVAQHIDSADVQRQVQKWGEVWVGFLMHRHVLAKASFDAERA